MGQVLSLPFKLLYTTFQYGNSLNSYIFGSERHKPFSSPSKKKFTTPFSSSLSNEKIELFEKNARIHLFSLASMFYLYKKPHYRKGTYRDDLIDNLRNVAIPGTGIPLSWFVTNRLVLYLSLQFCAPPVALLASLHKWFVSRGESSISLEYATRLLAPDDWFSYWRLNCNAVGLHSYLREFKKDYDMENKWTFLEQGEKKGVPISPYLKEPKSIFIKHRNEEGGMGIFCYKNATAGGDWILQERISNSEWVSSMLPDNAPLSTFRVITQSKGALLSNDDEEKDNKTEVTALSCVFRAGRANALTDHDSILFDVDITTGKILGGTTNAHWYKLGSVWSCPWRSKNHSFMHHPDVPEVQYQDIVIPDLDKMLRVAEESHAKLCPHVPFCGWDVVLCQEEPKLCLLEVNLSCNFFRGSFDKTVYMDYIEELFTTLQTARLVQDK